MAYKDKDRQREAVRRAQAKFKAKAKGITETGITNQRIVNQVIPNMRRGKDIECFEDLPLDVQQTIDRISDSPQEKLRRTANAIHYQHVFPDRYYPNSDLRYGT